MSVQVERYFVGPKQVFTAEKRRKQIEHENDWPYPHLFPPPSSEPVHAVTLTPVPVPIAGATVDVLDYQVPEGFRFFMSAIIENYTGGAFTPGDGIWSVFTNSPTGVSDIQAAPVQGLVGLPFQLGSWPAGVLWPFPRPYEFDSDTLVSSKFFNVNLTAGPPNFLISGFFGFLIPTLEIGR